MAPARCVAVLAKCNYCFVIMLSVLLAVLVPLLEKLLRIVVEINTQAANDATCMGIDDKEGPKRYPRASV